MKKKIFLLVLLLSVLMTSKVLAYNVKTLEASEDANGTISIKGTTKSEVMAVSINIYKEDGTTFVTQRNVQVNDDDTYSLTIKLDAGTYVIKAADYDGGDFKTVTVSSIAADEKSSSNEATPNTLDNVVVSIALAGISLAGIVGVILYFKKNNAKN